MKDLMKPRIIVTNPYPNMKFEVGEIIKANGHGKFIQYEDFGSIEIDPEYYSANFRLLSWWEFIDEKDMRGYFKCAWRGEIYCIKIDKWEKDGSMYYYKIDGMTFCANYSTPTTATDYENYLNQQKP